VTPGSFVAAVIFVAGVGDPGAHDEVSEESFPEERVMRGVDGLVALGLLSLFRVLGNRASDRQVRTRGGASSSHYGRNPCREQAKGRVDLFWIHNGRDSVSLSERPSNHAFSKKGFAIHLLMRSGRRGRRPSRAVRGTYQHPL